MTSVNDDDRRRHKRVPIEIPAKVYVPSIDRVADCALVNISPSGAQIQCKLRNLLDMPIVLHAAPFGRFDGHVVWNAQGLYGIRFSASESKQARLADQIAALEKQEPAHPAEQRRSARTPSNTLSQFTREDGSIVPCVVLDFSTSGLSVNPKVRPRIGEYVLIGGVAGRVVRYHETGIGIEFVRKEDAAKPLRKRTG